MAVFIMYSWPYSVQCALGYEFMHRVSCNTAPTCMLRHAADCSVFLPKMQAAFLLLQVYKLKLTLV